ncbi:hypothetical protein RJ641_001148 [Dillenia turbinata]|uniref:Ycf49-like protein n=1 Tax=Dillenia turbinata TaxID=194707 RepID=A0AAN8W812_9MAGN
MASTITLFISATIPSPSSKSRTVFTRAKPPSLLSNTHKFLSPLASLLNSTSTLSALVCAGGLALNFTEPAVALQLNEPSNALSLPTWAVHVSSVVEWISAMVLVWQYGEKSGYDSWKGLSWGMVPLLGGAFCACTWHFFYNSESLEVLVALQAALTVLGNATMCFAAFRIYKSVQGRSKNL